MKTSFGDECMGNTQIKQWYKWFKGDRISVDSDLCSGWPLMAKTNDNIEQVQLAIHEDRQLTV